MTQVYRFGLIGYPLDHSLSPQIHQAALESSDLRGEYKLYPLTPGKDTVQTVVERLRRVEIDGLNITIPHKQAVLPLVDRLTDTAAAVGAVNTLYLDGDLLVGHNTDVDGFWGDLRDHCPDLPEQGRALLLGAGGSARAVGYALVRSGWRIWVSARRQAQAEILVSWLQKSGLRASGSVAAVLPWSLRGRFPGKIDLLVNTTPVGMYPQARGRPWPRKVNLPRDAVIYDLVYNPPVTELLAHAGRSGLAAISGLGMLVEQAALAFECWTGLSPDRSVMIAAAQTALQERTSL